MSFRQVRRFDGGSPAGEGVDCGRTDGHHVRVVELNRAHNCPTALAGLTPAGAGFFLDVVVCNCILPGMKTPSPVELQLLSLVASEECSGREVAKLYKKEAGKSISYGTLYTTFRRLKEEGWVTVRDAEDEDGRVRYFRIAAPGVRALEAGRAYYVGLGRFGLKERSLAV